MEHKVVLTQWRDIGGVEGQDENKENMLNGIMLGLSPINSFLFAADGSLLHANNKAAQKIEKAGMQASYSAVLG